MNSLMASDEDSEESDFFSALNASLDVQVKEKLFLLYNVLILQKIIFSRAEHLIAYNYCTQELITANNKHRSTNNSYLMHNSESRYFELSREAKNSSK